MKARDGRRRIELHQETRAGRVLSYPLAHVHVGEGWGEGSSANREDQGVTQTPLPCPLPVYRAREKRIVPLRIRRSTTLILAWSA